MNLDDPITESMESQTGAVIGCPNGQRTCVKFYFDLPH